MADDRCSPEVRRVLKDAVGSMTTGDPAALARLRDMAGAFLSGPSSSCFDALLDGFFRAGILHARFAAGSSGATGSLVGEGLPKPVTRMRYSEGALTALTVQAMAVISRDLLRFAGADQVVQPELEKAVRLATDTVVTPILQTGAVQVAASGATARDVRIDMRDAMHYISAGADSRLAWLLPVKVARRLSVSPDTTGGRAFPALGPAGGELDGVPAFTSDALTTSALLVDGQSFVAAADPAIDLSTAQHAAIEMEDTPANASADGSPLAPTPATLVSMWQNNSVALQARRQIALSPIRAGGVVEVTGVDALWGREGEGSPGLPG
jgi:hypothetical protein